jgi:branched-subunit amino acid transport protein
MAGVTYIIRMVPFTLVNKKIENIYVKSFLYYVPYAVLGAMTVPSIFSSTGNVYTAIVGFIVAMILAFLNKSLLTVAVISCIAVFISGCFM